jgi:transcriptional regulator with XRE-family HTH domain
MSSKPARSSALIDRFRAWRTAKGLSQSKAAEALADAGLPIALRTLQQWEIGRRSPHAVTAAAIENFLDQQEKSSSAKLEKNIAPVIERLKAWRETNGLGQSQAVEALISAGLPAKLRTLQDWESGRHSPQPITAAALEKFLEEHPTITPPPANANPPPRSA